MSKLWNWWLKDFLDLYKNYDGTYAREDVAFATFATAGAVIALLLVSVMFLGLVLLTKGILLFVLLILGAFGYGVYKAVDGTLNGGDKDA